MGIELVRCTMCRSCCMDSSFTSELGASPQDFPSLTTCSSRYRSERDATLSMRSTSLDGEIGPPHARQQFICQRISYAIPLRAQPPLV